MTNQFKYLFFTSDISFSYRVIPRTSDLILTLNYYHFFNCFFMDFFSKYLFEFF